MKLNLLIDNPADVRNGYINVDPYAPVQDEHGRVAADLSDLTHSVDNGEAAEIIAYEILDYYPAKLGDALLDNWLRKLAHGGTLTISTVDHSEVARAIGHGRLSLAETNELLHGKQERDWDTRKASYTLDDLVVVLNNKGYKILTKRVRSLRAYITAQRV
jgi:hypothetical protein